MPRTFAHAFIVRAPLARVRAFHEDPSALRRLTPAILSIDAPMPPVRDSAGFAFTIFVPWRVQWRGHYENVHDDGFDDVMDEGPFLSWRHEHRYHSIDPSTTRVDDTITAEPTGATARLLWASLPATFTYRTMATRRACKRALQQIS